MVYRVADRSHRAHAPLGIIEHQGRERVRDAERINRSLPIFRRMPDLCDLLLRPTRAALVDQQWDLVISTYAPRYCHAVAYTIKKSRNTAFGVADFRDLWTQNHLAREIFPFTLCERWLERKA